MSKYLCKKSRHPTDGKCRKPTDSLPIISTGKREQQVLRYVKKSNFRFNVCECSRALNIPRTSVYEVLNTLQRKNLLTRNLANATLTSDGINYLNYINEGVGKSRKGCRDGEENLSQHKTNYKMFIKELDEHFVEKMKLLNYTNYKYNPMPNNPQHIFSFDDCTIIITKHKIRLKISEVMASDAEDCAYEAFCKATIYADKLNSIGVKSEGMFLEEAHYARVNSVLADILEKHLDKYSITLNDGSKFWIDNSPPNEREDETNNELLRGRLDEFIPDLKDSKSVMSDVDLMKDDFEKMKFVTSSIIESQLIMSKNISSMLKKEDLGEEVLLRERPAYFG